MFQPIDFVIFGAFLALSLAVGVYHGVRARFARFTHSADDEYLTGGHSLPLLPVCLSLLTTFVSGIALLGVPAEVYLRGASMGAAQVLGAFGFLIVGLFFVPMFYKLRFVNIYEYFEYRYDSAFLRGVGTCMFTLNTTFYMAVVIYAPAIALSGAAGLPIWPFILGVGAIGTIYTAIGGIKAVIWTDTLQAFVLFFGLTILIVKGTLDAGGLRAVLATNEATGRLTDAVFHMDPHPLQYNNFWVSSIGGTMHAVSVFGLNQMALQRYCAMPSLKQANIVMILTIPGNIAVGFMAIYIGLLIFAYFDGCDPVALGEVTTPDQLTIVLASRVLGVSIARVAWPRRRALSAGSIRGMPGVFLATLFSATLSTISSGLNSITAVVWEDVLKERVGDRDHTSIMKLVVLLLGAIATTLALSCQLLGTIYQLALSTLGAMAGPTAGLFFLGMFVPSANKHGAIAGFFVASAAMTMISVSYSVEKPYQLYMLPAQSHTTTSPRCAMLGVNQSALIDSFYAAESASYHYGAPHASAISRLSPFSYGITGIFLTVVVGVLVSWAWPHNLSCQKKLIAYACTRQGLHLPLPTRVPTQEPSTKELLEARS